MLPDIQSQADRRGVSIDGVGVTGLRYPLVFSDGTLTCQGMANIEILVGLSETERGTHMSRMVEFTHEHLTTFDPRGLPRLLKEAARRLNVTCVRIRIAMPFATEVIAPVSRAVSWQPHELEVVGELSNTGTSVLTAVKTEITSVCPCSKAISDYGAHNQRSEVCLRISADADDPYPLPVLAAVGLVREFGSCPVHPVIKRSDERFVTMTAHDRPAFVEDIVRDISLECRRRSLTHCVAVRNLESIHSHDAYAEVSYRSDGSA